MLRTYIVLITIAVFWLVLVPILTCCKCCIDACFGYSRPCITPCFPLMTEPEEEETPKESKEDVEVPEAKGEADASDAKKEPETPEAEKESEASPKKEQPSITTPCVPWCSYCMWYCCVSVCFSIIGTIVVLIAIQIWINSTFPALEAVPVDPPTQVQTAVASFTIALESEPTNAQVNKVQQGIQAELNKSDRKLEETDSETCEVEVSKQQVRTSWELLVTVTCTKIMTVESSSELDTTGLEEFQSSVENNVITTTKQIDTIVADASGGQLTVTSVSEIQVRAKVELECNDYTDAQLQKVIEPWADNIAGYGISKDEVEKYATCSKTANPGQDSLDEMNDSGSDFRGYIDDFNSLAGNDIIKLPDGKLESFCGIKLRGDPEDIELGEVCPKSCNFGQCGQSSGERKLEH